MRRGRILILLGLILAIGTAAAVYVVVNSMESSQTAEIVLEDVVVALQPIPEEELVEGRIGLVAIGGVRTVINGIFHPVVIGISDSAGDEYRRGDSVP